MKYSIIMPFYKKHRELKITLDSYFHFYNHREDYEIVIVIDYKNDLGENKDLENMILRYNDKLNITTLHGDDTNGYNPAALYNAGVEYCDGSYIVLTNPENAHNTNILAEMDKVFIENKNSYIVCGCQNVEVDSFKNIVKNDYKKISWYQHSKFRPANYHFCSAISKENYNEIGGFDEEFSKGIGYDDDDFRDSVIDANLDVAVRDDLLTLHVSHESSFELDNYAELVNVNKMYYLKKKCSKPGVRIGLGIPLSDDKVYRQFHESWVKLIKPANYTYLTPKFPGRIEDIRNQIVEQALEKGCTHLIFMDTDQIYPEDFLVKIMSHDKDVVGTAITKRYPPFNVLVMRGSLGKYRLVPDEDIENIHLLECDASGTGAIMFRTEVFFHASEFGKWFQVSVTDDGRPIGEDVYFCSELRKAGYKIWIDTTIDIKHLGILAIDYNFYKLFKDLENLRKETTLDTRNKTS